MSQYHSGESFCGSKREVIGEVELPVQVGPCTFQIVFQVMDILPAYSCLLGRPWIHTAGVVPSTLHQKLKFVIDDKLIIVSGEEDLVVCDPHPLPILKLRKKFWKPLFRLWRLLAQPM